LKHLLALRNSNDLESINGIRYRAIVVNARCGSRATANVLSTDF